jgi:oligoendopeptidase F
MNETKATAVPKKNSRKFIGDSVDFNSWKSLQPYYDDLKNRSLSSLEELKKWISDFSEVDAAVSEHLGWLYIRMTCDTMDKKLSDAYNYFVTEIQPNIAPYDDEMNKKFLECGIKNQLNEAYKLYLRSVENQVRIFRNENIPLLAELSVKEQKYGEISGAMTVEMEGKLLTLQQAGNYLKRQDRKLREEAYTKISGRRLQDRNELDSLFNELLELRHRIALNAGFKNYRDYKFVDLDRFDYTPGDCVQFHESVGKTVVPVLDTLLKKREQELAVDALKPWDLEVDTFGKPELKPFANGEDLVQKTIRCFYSIHPYFGKVVETLHSTNHLDLDSRIGKAPGGYNYPLYETGIPFIFMNSSGTLRDVETMVHEGGHAIHSMLTSNLEFVGFKDFPSEVAELASMSMELISMEHWNYFFDNADDLQRAKKEQLEGVLKVLPWISCIDKFQHWLYLHNGHTVEERTEAWLNIYSEFSGSAIDWSGVEEARAALWQKQLHLFEVPFYYIEYGMAQLGAIAIWRNYKTNPAKAIEQYMDALKLGSTKSISDIYSTAGIRFDFSEKYIKELADFVLVEIENL